MSAGRSCGGADRATAPRSSAARLLNRLPRLSGKGTDVIYSSKVRRRRRRSLAAAQMSAAGTNHGVVSRTG